MMFVYRNILLLTEEINFNYIKEYQNIKELKIRLKKPYLNKGRVIIDINNLFNYSINNLN